MVKFKFLILVSLLSAFTLSGCSNSALNTIDNEASVKTSSVDGKDYTPEELLDRLNKSIDFSTSTINTFKNTNLKLFIDGPEAYPELEKMILSAKKSVYVEVFEFHNDATGKRISDALIKKAKEGLEVKFIYDFIGNKDITLMQNMAKNGVQVLTYGKDVKGASSIVTHRKLYIIDGTRAMTGGMNIDANFASDGLYHDILMSYNGEAVKKSIDEFFNDWEASGGRLTQAMRDIYNEPIDSVVRENEKTYTIRVAITNPLKKREDIYKMMLAGLDSAKYSVNMAMPYFTDDELLNHIISAKNRGVKVRVLIPNKTSMSAVTIANTMTSNQLVKAGVEVYRGGVKDNSFNHSKVMTIDDVWTTIGSCNADYRAFHSNQELNLAVSDIEFTNQVNTRFFSRFIGEAKKADYENIPWYKKPLYGIVERIDNLF